MHEGSRRARTDSAGIAQNRKRDKPVEQMIIGIDGAFVRFRRPTDRASLEIITGRIEADAEESKV